MPMRYFVLAITVVGGIASLVGVAWIVVNAHRGANRIRSERQRILDWPQSDSKSAEMRAAGIDFTTWNDLMTLRQDVALAVLESARLTGPVVLTLAGITISTIASMLSLFVD